MYDNIGGKIKGLAIAIFIIETIAALITGIALIASDEDMIPIGFLAIVVVPLVAWVSSWLLYGFGELIDKACDIERNTCKGKRKSETQEKEDSERINKLVELHSQGLITEEEYQQIISKKP